VLSGEHNLNKGGREGPARKKGIAVLQRTGVKTSDAANRERKGMRMIEDFKTSEDTDGSTTAGDGGNLSRSRYR